MNYIAIPGMKWRGTYEENQTIASLPKRQERVLKAVMQHFNISWIEMNSKCRKRRVLLPRQISMYLLHKLLGMGCVDVAKMFDADHTTAIHNFKLIQDLMDTNDNFANEIRGIRENII